MCYRLWSHNLERLVGFSALTRTFLMLVSSGGHPGHQVTPLLRQVVSDMQPHRTQLQFRVRGCVSMTT